MKMREDEREWDRTKKRGMRMSGGGKGREGRVDEVGRSEGKWEVREKRVVWLRTEKKKNYEIKTLIDSVFLTYV